MQVTMDHDTLQKNGTLDKLYQKWLVDFVPDNP